MTFLDREKPRRWLWGFCFLLVLVLVVMAVIYRRLQVQRPEPVWWQSVANNLDREAVFITLDTCTGFLHQADCQPGDFSDLSLIGRSFATDTHYYQEHREDLVDRMVSPAKQAELATFKADREIKSWWLVFDIQIESESVGYFRSRLVASPDQPDLATDLAAADLISSDQLEILSRGWYRYDSLPEVNQVGNYWLDWVEATRPFFYGRLELNSRQDLADQLRRRGVYQFTADQVGQLDLGDPGDRFYEYQVEVGCQQLFEVWSDYSETIGQPAGFDQDNADRCDGPNTTASTDRLYDYDLVVRVNVDQARIVAFGRQYQDEFFTRQTLSPPGQLSPWDADPDEMVSEANFDDHVVRLLPSHN